MRHAVFLLIVFLAAVPVAAQGTEKDPLGCSTPEGKAFSFVVGDWKVKSKFRVGSNPDNWEETQGTSKIEYTFEGCLAREDLRIKRNGRPLNVVSMFSYSNISRKYQWMYAHSEHGVLSLFEGDKNGKIFNFKDSVEVRGRTFLFERRMKKTDSGFVLVARRSFDQGKTWRDDWYLEYSKL